MKVIFPTLCCVLVAMAEPPVGDGYPAARSSTDHHHDDLYDPAILEQRSLPQEYGLPSSLSGPLALPGSLSPNSGYSSTRTAPSSRTYSPPTARVSFSQRFSSAASRNPKKLAAALKSLSQEYAAPNARISQEYGAPEARSLSQEYGVPSVSSRTLSTEYGAPDARSEPSQEYGTPVISARSNQPNPHGSTFHSRPRSGHGFPAAPIKSQLQDGSLLHGSSSSRSNVQGFDGIFGARTAPKSTYGVPSSSSSSYDIPSARSSESYSQEHNSISSTYVAPNQRDVSETYSVPSARSPSQEYGAPSSRNLKTSAVASSYASTRSSPSSTYLPANRSNTPSEEYGVPENDERDQYELAKAREALEELLNQEPANYDFRYQIEDNEFGSDFGHAETRLEDRAEGSYFVVLPDGTKQTVEYSADEHGFKPRISVEALEGYDGTSAARNSGPY